MVKQTLIYRNVKLQIGTNFNYAKATNPMK